MSQAYFMDGNDHPCSTAEVALFANEPKVFCQAGCGNEVHPESTRHECCAACTVESYICELMDHNLERPNPMTQEWFTQGAEIEKQIMIWKIKAAQ